MEDMRRKGCNHNQLKLKSLQPTVLTMEFLHGRLDLPGLSDMFDNDNE